MKLTYDDDDAQHIFHDSELDDIGDEDDPYHNYASP